MIFVTVGTHEQQFNRLVQKVDELVRDEIITDEVFMQIGYSTYEPKHCKWAKVISYDEMSKYEAEADVIITHGGPATFMAALSKGKSPIVVPRLEKFDEHVNNHQLDFALKVKERGYNILIVEEVDIIMESISSLKNDEKMRVSNTSNFNHKFKEIVDTLIKEKR